MKRFIVVLDTDAGSDLDPPFNLSDIAMWVDMSLNHDGHRAEATVYGSVEDLHSDYTERQGAFVE